MSTTRRKSSEIRICLLANFFLLTTLFLSVAQADPGNPIVGRVAESRGGPEIRHRGDTNFSPLGSTGTIRTDDRLRTGKGGKVYLILDDGTQVSLGTESLAEPAVLRPGWETLPAFLRPPSKVRFIVEPLRERRAGFYVVETPTATLTVDSRQGQADFVVEVPDDLRTIVTVICGIVEVRNILPRLTKTQALYQGRQCFVDREKPPSPGRTVSQGELQALERVTTIPGTMPTAVRPCGGFGRSDGSEDGTRTGTGDGRGDGTGDGTGGSTGPGTGDGTGQGTGDGGCHNDADCMSGPPNCQVCASGGTCVKMRCKDGKKLNPKTCKCEDVKPKEVDIECDPLKGEEDTAHHPVECSECQRTVVEHGVTKCVPVPIEPGKKCTSVPCGYCDGRGKCRARTCLQGEKLNRKTCRCDPVCDKSRCLKWDTRSSQCVSTCKRDEQCVDGTCIKCDPNECKKLMKRTVAGKTYATCVDACRGKDEFCADGKCIKCDPNECKKLMKRTVAGKTYATCVDACRGKDEFCADGKCTKCDPNECKKLVKRTVGGKTYATCVDTCKGSNEYCANGKCNKCDLNECKKLVKRTVGGKTYAACVDTCSAEDSYCSDGQCRKCDTDKCEKLVKRQVRGRTYAQCVSKCTSEQKCRNGKCWDGPEECPASLCQELVTREQGDTIYAQCKNRCGTGQQCMEGTCFTIIGCDQPCSEANCQRMERQTVGTTIRCNCVSLCSEAQRCQGGRCVTIDKCEGVVCGPCEDCDRDLGVCVSLCSEGQRCQGERCVTIDKCEGVMCPPCMRCDPDLGICVGGCGPGEFCDDGECVQRHGPRWPIPDGVGPHGPGPRWPVDDGVGPRWPGGRWPGGRRPPPAY